MEYSKTLGDAIKLHDREFFLYFIISGRKYYNDEIYLDEPSIDILQKASVLYKKIYDRCMEEKIHDYISIMNILIHNNLWSIQDEEDLLKNIPERINDIKVDILESSSLSYLRLSKDLGQETKKLKELYSRRHYFDSFICEGIAELSKIEFLVEQCTNADFDIISKNKMISFFASKYIDESTMRFLCRNNPWQDIWSAAKKNNSYVFNENACCLSDNQKKIILWSGLYDNIREFTDCPSQDVIDDDIKLDGWLIKKNREREIKKARENLNISKNKKINDAQEIFIVVNNAEEARAVESMNSFQANLIKQSRLAKLQKEGSVDKQHFSDIKQELRMKINQEVLRNGR